MKKTVRYLCVPVLIAAVAFVVGLLKDRQTLGQEIIRLHVVANSDSAEDQRNKLKVRDAVLSCMEDVLSCAASQQEAVQLLEANLDSVADAASAELDKLGADNTVTARLCREAFGKREYDTFSLPAGIYESLRIEIGSGSGKNWWCVVFPSLCLDGFRDTAVSAGFSDTLTNTLSLEDGYEVRFFLLDCLGWVENFLFQS